MEKILAFIKKYYPFIFFVIIILLSIFLFQTCSNLKKEKADSAFQSKLYIQNVKAITDSITKSFNTKLNAYEFTKDNLVLNKISDLEQYNKSLSDQLKGIKGDVLSAIQTNVEGNLGGIQGTNNLEVLDSTSNHYGLKFATNYVDSGFKQQITGVSKFYAIPNNDTKKWTITPDATILDTDLTSISVTYGFKDLKDKYEVFAISKSPKVKITDLSGGYFINKQIQAPVKQKKWGIGPYGGFGLNTLPNLGNPQFGWSIGFGVHYSILQW